MFPPLSLSSSRYGLADQDSKTQHFIKVAGKRGGDAKIVGNVVSKDGDWNEISIVHYPSIKHFCDMLAGEDYQAINDEFRLPVSVDCEKEMILRNLRSFC